MSTEQVTINYTYERGSTQAVVLGLTAAKLVESRTSQIEGWEQVSTLPVGDATVTVYWSLRETPDDRGRPARCRGISGRMLTTSSSTTCP